jgi:hypothetical protein
VNVFEPYFLQTNHSLSKSSEVSRPDCTLG